MVLKNFKANNNKKFILIKSLLFCKQKRMAIKFVIKYIYIKNSLNK